MATSSTEAKDKELTKHLIRIKYEKLELSTSEASKNKQIVKATIESLVKAMKITDQLFENIYKHEIYTGSYYEHLRVKHATEFDVNMVLSLPFRKEDIELTMSNDAPGFFQFRLNKDPMLILSRRNENWSFCQEFLVDLFSNDRILLRSKFQSWIHSVITKAMASGDFNHIKYKQSGPAFTLNIPTTEGRKIDVDLVPVIRLPTDHPIPEEVYQIQSSRFKKLNLANDCCLVPKSTSDASNRDFLWRISFPETEKKLLPTGEEACVRTLIMLMKLLRDTHDQWTTLASYYIKTVFLLELDEPRRVIDCECMTTDVSRRKLKNLCLAQESNSKDWPQNQLGPLFKKMLDKLKIALDKGELPYYFVRKANLMISIDKENAKNISNHIANILKAINANPEKIKAYFKCE